MVLSDRPAQAKRLSQGELPRQDYRGAAAARRRDRNRVGYGRLIARPLQAGPQPVNGPGFPRATVRQGELAPYCSVERRLGRQRGGGRGSPESLCPEVAPG